MLIPADSHALWRQAGVRVVARDAVSYASISQVRGKNRTSFFADPVSWLIAEAAEAALAGCQENLSDLAEDVATITVSDFCTIATMAQIAAQVPAGRLSPLRFSAATPGAAGSLPAMSFGFRGPSLTLSVSPEAGLGPAVVVAGSWLGNGRAAFVVLTCHDADVTGGHTASSVILAPRAEH